MCIQIIALHDRMERARKKKFRYKREKMERNAKAMREKGRHDFIAAGNTTRVAGNENRRQPTL